MIVIAARAGILLCEVLKSPKWKDNGEGVGSWKIPEACLMNQTRGTEQHLAFGL